MNKNDKLLQEVDVFYKQAVYSDRSSFLNAIAQDGSRLSEQMRERIESLIKDVASIKPNSQDLQNRLMDYVTLNTANRVFNKQELNNLYQTIHEASALIYGPEHAPQAERASELAQMVQQLISSEPYGPSLVGGQSPKADTSAYDTFKTTTPAKPAGPTPFPKDVQDKLNAMLKDLAIKGDVFYVPFKSSGVLDAGTQKALDSWRKYMNMPKASLAELVNNIKQYYNLVFEPNSHNG